MDDSERIEKLNEMLHKLQRQFNVKIEMEKDYLIELDLMNKKYEDLKKNDVKHRERIEQLQNRVTSLNYQINDVEQLRKQILKKNENIEYLQKSLNEKNIKCEELESKLKLRRDSPTKAINKIHKDYRFVLEGLKAELVRSEQDVENLKQREAYLKEVYRKDIEIMKCQNEENKNLLSETRKEKEEAEGRLMTLQNESVQTDFTKQGNNLYSELDDRRTEAEKRLRLMQDELNKQSNLSANLRVFIQHAFVAFSTLKEDKFRETRRILANDVDLLRSENSMLHKQVRLIKRGEILSDESSITGRESALKLTLELQKLELKNLKTGMASCTARTQAAEKLVVNKFSERERSTMEVVNLKKEISDLNLKLACWDSVADAKIKGLFKSSLQETLEYLKTCEFLQSEHKSILPGTYGQAIDRNSETLQMDFKGVPVENRLIQAIRKNLLEPANREIGVQWETISDWSNSARSCDEYSVVEDSALPPNTCLLPNNSAGNDVIYVNGSDPANSRCCDLIVSNSNDIIGVSELVSEETSDIYHLPSSINDKSNDFVATDQVLHTSTNQSAGNECEVSSINDKSNDFVATDQVLHTSTNQSAGNECEVHNDDKENKVPLSPDKITTTVREEDSCSKDLPQQPNEIQLEDNPECTVS